MESEGGMSSRTRWNQGGFTLLELVLATLIASLVIGMLSMALTFSLGMWQREQNRQPDNTAAMVELLKFQLAGVDTTPISYKGQTVPLFEMEEDSIAFITTHSVKALSKGAPAVVRYHFNASEGRLYYGELPFDPYHPELIEEFLMVAPMIAQDRPLFFAVEMSGFSLLPEQEEERGFPSGEAQEAIPSVILLRWTGGPDAPPATLVLRTNHLFPKVVKTRVIEDLGETF